MKKLFLILLSSYAIAASAQVKKTPAVTKPGAPAKVLNSLSDSASYAIGLSVVNFYLQQGINKFNTALITRAINDVLNKKTVLMNSDQANAAMMKLMNQSQETKAKPNIIAGQKFLAQNKNKPNVKTTASGLQYEVIRAGDGVKPAINDSVEVNYAGTLINGTEFDNSYKRGQPITFALTVGGLIGGWIEGLQLMPVGSKYKLYVPYELGYGLHGSPDGSIPPGSALIFEIELIRVARK